MGLRVAVDFGASSTCVALSASRGQPRIVPVDGSALLPSAVYAAADGALTAGHPAIERGAVDPARYEPHPKRRMDEGELLLGTSVVAVTDVVRAVLARGVGEARRAAGGAPVELLAVTHPADWGVVRTRVLRQAASGLARQVTLVPEPVAAAVLHAVTGGLGAGADAERTVALRAGPAATLAVLDVGGATVDAAVVRRDSAAPADSRLLASAADRAFGGDDIDQVLLEHVESRAASTDPDTWQELLYGTELGPRRRRTALRAYIRRAKETLSVHGHAEVPLPEPFTEVRVSRGELEELLEVPVGRILDVLAAVLADAGLTASDVTGVLLVGGSSRTPLLARLARERLGLVPTTTDEPETVVARGALYAVG